MFEPGNSNIIIPDRELQQCFDTWVIYTPDIYNYCINHIIPAPIAIASKLTKECFVNNFYVETPRNIIFNDPSSLFWLHPEINGIINLTKPHKIAYSWSELKELFLDFCTTDTYHFTRLDESIIVINSSSELASLFSFKFFKIDQVDAILKGITKFLGKKNTLEKCCKHLTFINPHNVDNEYNNKIFKFIDLAINNYNSMLPYVPSMCVNI
jgi:hypothetical protein